MCKTLLAPMEMRSLSHLQLMSPRAAREQTHRPQFVFTHLGMRNAFPADAEQLASGAADTVRGEPGRTGSRVFGWTHSRTRPAPRPEVQGPLFR